MRTAVVLFNLGGPDRPESVRPFLFNLFNDPAIIRLPAIPRWLVATLISRRRAPVAQAIYARLGGGSPILANTRRQAEALDAALGDAFKTFVVMRYWHPRAAETAKAVKAWKPDKVVLLPLYPQFSTTTTASSLKEWRKVYPDAIPGTALCCWPELDGLAEGYADLARPLLAEASARGAPRLLYSAHGLPQRIVDAGDPYPVLVERTAAAISARLGQVDSVVCYQSRVGPLKWVGPSTEDELHRAAADGVPVVVLPLAFVSDHSETLVEIEEEYRELALELGVPSFHRVPAIGDHPAFIGSLADLVRRSVDAADGVRSGPGHRLCPAECGACPHA